MSTPQPAAGDRQNAMVNVTLAMDLLEQTLPQLGSESEEGAAVLDFRGGIDPAVPTLAACATTASYTEAYDVSRTSICANAAARVAFRAASCPFSELHSSFTLAS